MIERIEERVRNMMSPFYLIAQLIEQNKNGYISDENVLKYIKSTNMEEAMKTSIKYLIDMGKTIDDNLPDDFDINKLLDKTSYYNHNNN